MYLAKKWAINSMLTKTTPSILQPPCPPLLAPLLALSSTQCKNSSFLATLQHHASFAKFHGDKLVLWHQIVVRETSSSHT